MDARFAPRFALTCPADSIKCSGGFVTTAPWTIIMVHRFVEVIGGRVYRIEAARVRDDRWRAQLVRIPGMPTALMPFYGATPDEAARQLRDWLARAHHCSPGPA